MDTKFTEKDAETLINGKLSRYYGVSLKEADKGQIYKAVVMAVKDILLEQRDKFYREHRSKNGKRVYYLCMEFLMGQSLKNNTYNMGVRDQFGKVLAKRGLTMEDLYDC
ncbi:MAG: alpha-glucan phosphorylase, partial [Clostridia bacterium]|nr:alpha-glucan phosphorylase [Clostridia bacterium]